MSSATPITLLTIVIAAIIASTHGRIITFKNSCPFNIDVEKITNGDHNIEQVCPNLGANGGRCQWTIPFRGWAGNFHRRNAEGGNTGFPSGTLAEFAFPDLSIPSQWNMDFFDISIIPPGCPGTIFSYDGCWCNGGNDGYDVGMVMRPLRCPDKTRTCKGRYCNDAYLFPKDDSKTTACTDTNTDWEVEFCPSGSHIDLHGRGVTSQTAPCRGGPNPSPPAGQNPPSNPPPPPSSNGNCGIENGVDYFGDDISNRPAGNAGECCNHCHSTGGCAAWTLAGGVCYMKHASARSNRVSNGGAVSGYKNVGASNPPPSNPPPPPPPPSNPPPPPPPPQHSSHCSLPCVRGGFAGTCTSNCPPCYIPAGSGWNCFDKSNGACPAWPGMTDCSAGGRKVAAHEGESATFNEQNSSPVMNNSMIIGLSVGIVVLVVVLIVVVLIAVSNSKQSKVETV